MAAGTMNIGFGSGHFHIGARQEKNARTFFERKNPHILCPKNSVRHAPLHEISFAHAKGVRIVRPFAIRLGDSKLVVVRERRDRSARNSFRGVHPHADAIRLGFVFRLLQAERRAHADFHESADAENPALGFRLVAANRLDRMQFILHRA